MQVLVTMTLENGKTTTVKITCPVAAGKNFKLILKPVKLSADDLVIIKQEDEAKLKAKHAKAQAEKEKQEAEEEAAAKTAAAAAATATARPSKPRELDPERAARRDQRRVARQKFASRTPGSSGSSSTTPYRARGSTSPAGSPTSANAPRVSFGLLLRIVVSPPASTATVEPNLSVCCRHVMPPSSIL